MSLEIKKNIPLRTYTTLGVGGEVLFFASVTSDSELSQATQWAKAQGVPFYVLGGGSNTLVSDDGYDGLVIHMVTKGSTFEVVGTSVLLTVQAGELLDDVVAYSVAQGWWGMENLSHIPGTIGATPIQNVGAYGVEVKDIISSVRVFNTETNEFEVFSNEACAFEYRDSFFKTTQGKKYIVTAVTFKLSQIENPKITYHDLAKKFDGLHPSVQQIRTAVIEIRAGKFPNWHEVGTAGSFFKNPIITKEKFDMLKAEYEALPGFSVGQSHVKISLGWVLDKVLSLRGYRANHVATYEHQALVLVVDRDATSREVENFANEIIEKIKNKIGIVVEWEVTKIK